MASRRKTVPRAVIGRLTKYLTYAQDLCEQKVEWVSSAELAEALGLTSSTVRQDLLHVDFYGIAKRGYRVDGLRQVLTRFLGADAAWNTVVVGAGNLGKALARHGEFARRGFRIVGIFDNDPRKVGSHVNNLRVEPIRDLPGSIVSKKAEVGIIAVPATSTQAVADLMILSGIKGLLNLTLTHVLAPRGVKVVEVRLTASLWELAHLIKSDAGRAARPARG